MPSKRCGLKDCRKKLSLVDESVGKCSCEKVFCSKHRYASEHNCTFDHSKVHREIIAKQNQQIVADKVLKI